MKKTAHFSQAKINKISKSLNISVAGVYLAILLVVSFVGIFVANNSLNQSQDTHSAASSYQTVGCNQPCPNNRYCQANYFCYQGRCRLAANPKSITCDPTEVVATLTPTKTPSPTDDPLAGQKGEPVKLPTATKEVEATTSAKNMPTNMPTIDESDYQPIPLPEVKPSLISRVANQFNTPDNQLLLIIGAGIGGLVALIILITIINGKKSKIQYQPANFDNLETPQNKSNLQTPTPVVKPNQPSSPSSKKDKLATQTSKLKQTPAPTAQNQDLTPPPSSMISRIKEKKIQKPKNN